MDNAQIAHALFEIADAMDLLGENAFKVRAYRQAAQVIDLLPGPVSELYDSGELTGLPGIGDRMASHIGELIEDGRCEEHERILEGIPRGLLEVMKLEGVGPKTADVLWKKGGIVTVDALEQACKDGTILKLPRMGKTRASSILRAIASYRKRSGRLPLHHAIAQADSLLEYLRAIPEVIQAEVAGSVRRRKETVGDLDLLVLSRHPKRVLRSFVEIPEISEILASGPTKSSVRLKSGMHADLRILPESSFGAALHYFTGSKAHNIAIRARAVRMGKKINEYGVFDRGGERLSGKREEDVFKAVDLPFIPPELREGAGEIEAAQAGKLPRLVEDGDLLGDLHIHTKASSDARATIEEVAKEARRLGREYIAITDHSRSRPLGLDAAGVKKQAEEIRAMNRKLRGRPYLFSGIEVDILKDGALDLPIDVLAGLDCVVASVHSHFSQSRSKMTERIVRALSSGVVHILGHPSGRQIDAREAYEFDWGEVLRAARAYDVALEINAMPDRLDVDDKGCRLAKEAGVLLAISSDAHSTGHLYQLRNGVWVARRGWLEAGDILNTRKLPELRRWLTRRRRRADAIEAPSPG